MSDTPPSLCRYYLSICVAQGLAVSLHWPERSPAVVLLVGVVALMPFPKSGRVVNVLSVVARRPLALSAAGRRRINLELISRRDRQELTGVLIIVCMIALGLVNARP